MGRYEGSINETQMSNALKRLQTETAAELDALLPALLDRALKGEPRYPCAHRLG
jgi:hypothetical protein